MIISLNHHSNTASGKYSVYMIYGQDMSEGNSIVSRQHMTLHHNYMCTWINRSDVVNINTQPAQTAVCKEVRQDLC